MGRLFRGKIKGNSKTANIDVCNSSASTTRKTRTTSKHKTTGDKQTNQLICNTADAENKQLFVNSNNNENEEIKNSGLSCHSSLAYKNHIPLRLNREDDGYVASETSASTDSNACSCPDSIPGKNKTLNSKQPTNNVKKTKRKNDPENNILHDCNHKNKEKHGFPIDENLKDTQFVKEALPRSVLTDKTNSVSKHNLNNCEKIKRKVHFSSVNSVRRITQRRISDFFNSEDHHHKIKEFPELKPTHGSCEKLNDKRVLNESLKILDESLDEKLRNKKLNNGADLSKSVLHGHIPVYKQPVVDGRESFCLTPPKVADKDALYEFEVDENEEPRVNKKKRRPVKTYKRRKRLCTNRIVIKPSEVKNIPQRTMTLRTDQQISENRIAEICADAELIEIDVPRSDKPNNNPSVNGGKIFNGHVTENLPVKNIAVSNKSFHQGSSHSTDTKITESSTLAENTCDVQKNNEKNIDVGVLSSNSSKMNVISTSQEGKFVDYQCSSSNVSVISHALQNADNSYVPNCKEKTTNDVSNCAYTSHSPLPEYSRLHESIQIGPAHNSDSVNCSESEFACNFMRGVTASTPYRTIQSPLVKHDFQIRLSGGEVSNRFHQRRIVESDSDSEEEFFGFRVNENHEDSIHHLDNTPQKENDPINNEPVQKISVKEVISILKKNFGTNSKEHKKNFTEKKAHLFDDSFLLTPSCDNYDGSPEVNNDTIFSHSRSPSINKYFTKGCEKKKNRVQIEEPDISFSKPARRSYSITPRKKNLHNYREFCGDSGEDSEEDIEVQKKPQRRVNKPSKKEEKEMNKLAAMMNSQFQEVEKYKLLIE